MRESFQGWRRKVGGLTLLMASFFMGAWVRSLTYTEIFDFAKGDYTTDILYSFDCAFVWRKVFQESPDLRTTFQEWESVPTTRHRYQFLTDDRIIWIWRWAGAGLGIHVVKPNDLSYFVILPYWFIALPLTSISAYLLISKPGKILPQGNVKQQFDKWYVLVPN